MNGLLKTRQVYFSTFTINKWISIFIDFKETNKFILDCLQFLNIQKSVSVYSFVIMQDHIHVIWEILKHLDIKSIENSFKINTARNIVIYLKSVDLSYLDNYFRSLRKDRHYKIWKLNSNSFHLLHPDILKVKLNYIHLNPTRGNYKSCTKAEQYLHSSALSYKEKKYIFAFYLF